MKTNINTLTKYHIIVKEPLNVFIINTVTMEMTVYLVLLIS